MNGIYNVDKTLPGSLIGQKHMFYQSIKHTKSVFHYFSPHYQYIIKQLPAACVFYGSFLSSNTRLFSVLL